MQKKTILEFCLSPDLGGLELFMLSCVEHFSTKTTVFTAVAPNKKLQHALADDTVFVLKRNKFFPLLPAIKLARFIDEKQIDIIHFHWTRDMSIVILAKQLSIRKPKVIQSRHMSMTRFKDDMYHKWLYGHIDMIHAVTHQVKEQLETFIPPAIRPNIEVVYPGTSIPLVNDTDKARLSTQYDLNDHFVVGMVGRIEEAKGQYLLLEAIARLKSFHIKALIVGHTMTASYLEALKMKAITLGIEDNIVFTGFIKEVNTHMQLCDLTVLATKKETFGLVVIESMANGVPVIARHSGGPLEIIQDNVDGYFFDGTVQDLTDKIQMLYNNKILQEKIAINALQHVKEKFDQSTQLTKLVTIMDTI